MTQIRSCFAFCSCPPTEVYYSTLCKKSTCMEYYLHSLKQIIVYAGIKSAYSYLKKNTKTPQPSWPFMIAHCPPAAPAVSTSFKTGFLDRQPRKYQVYIAHNQLINISCPPPKRGVPPSFLISLAKFTKVHKEPTKLSFLDIQ